MIGHVLIALFARYEQVAARLRRLLPCWRVHILLSHLASSSRTMSRCIMIMKRQHSAVQAALSDGSPRPGQTKQQVRQIMARYRTLVPMPPHHAIIFASLYEHKTDLRVRMDDVM